MGRFPLPVEVIPMARSHVARKLVKLGADPVHREGVTTDNGTCDDSTSPQKRQKQKVDE